MKQFYFILFYKTKTLARIGAACSNYVKNFKRDL